MSESWDFSVSADLNADKSELGQSETWLVLFDHVCLTPETGHLIDDSGTAEMCQCYQEWQHDGFASTFPVQPDPNPSGNVDFNTTWDVEVNYVQPLGDTPFKFRSLLVVHGQKGCGEPCQPSGPGLLRTTEILTQQILVFDGAKWRGTCLNASWSSGDIAGGRTSLVFSQTSPVGPLSVPLRARGSRGRQ